MTRAPPQAPHCHVPRAGHGPAGRVHRGGPGRHGHLQQTRHQVWTQGDQVSQECICKDRMCLHYFFALQAQFDPWRIPVPMSAIYNCHHLRTESVMVRPRSHATGENPFSRLQVADIGDVVASLYNVQVGVTARCAGGDIVPAWCRLPAPPSLRSTPPSSLAAACRSPWAGTTSSPTPSCGQQPPRTAPSRSE